MCLCLCFFSFLFCFVLFCFVLLFLLFPSCFFSCWFFVMFFFLGIWASFSSFEWKNSKKKLKSKHLRLNHVCHVGYENGFCILVGQPNTTQHNPIQSDTNTHPTTSSLTCPPLQTLKNDSIGRSSSCLTPAHSRSRSPFDRSHSLQHFTAHFICCFLLLF